MKKTLLLITTLIIGSIESAERTIPSLQEIVMQKFAPTIHAAIKAGNLADLEKVPFNTLNEKVENIGKETLLNQSLKLFDHTFTAALIEAPLEHISQHDINCNQASPDGCYIAFGDANGTLTLFDATEKVFISTVLFDGDGIESLEWDNKSQSILTRTSSGLCGIYNIFDGTLYDLSEEEDGFIIDCFWVKNSTMIYFLIGTGHGQEIVAIDAVNLVDNNKDKYSICEDVFSEETNFYVKRYQKHVVYNYSNNFILFDLASGEFSETSIDLPEDSTCELQVTSYNQHTNTLFIQFKNEPLNYLLSLATLEIDSFPGVFLCLGWDDASTMIHGTPEQLNFIEISADPITVPRCQSKNIINFFNTSKLASSIDSDFFALIQPETRSYSLEIIKPGMKKSIRLFNFQNDNIYASFTENMQHTYIIQGILDTHTKILIYDTSLLFCTTLSLKQIVLLEFMVHHHNRAAEVSQSDFWRDAFESLPEKIKTIIKKTYTKSSCTIL